MKNVMTVLIAAAACIGVVVLWPDEAAPYEVDLSVDLSGPAISPVSEAP